VNNYLNTIRLSDALLETVVDGLKARQLYNDTLMIIMSDHGFAFHDWGRKSLATWKVSLESGFSIPLMFHNPHLEAKQLRGQFTNMDLLPTIMDVLLSSQASTHQLTNHLLSVEHDKLQSILSRYEGITLFRSPAEQQIERYTFHLANPGNTKIIVRQYPRKLVYDIYDDYVYVYHLIHDPQESINLIDFDHDSWAVPYPDWVQNDLKRRPSRNWKGQWVHDKNHISDYHRNLLKKHFDPSMSNTSSVSLTEMLDWADATLQLAAVWTTLVRTRYLYGNKTVHRLTDDLILT
jgi:lipoteichoic acid synthase